MNFLPELSARAVSRHIAAVRREGDKVIVSIHWGGNWGYEVADAEREFARGLLEAGADIVHGHSSHHAKRIEFHRGRPILYGCGDLLNDYEGIEGHESYRADLAALYFLEPGGDVELAPFRMRRFRLERAAEGDARWLAKTLGLEKVDASLVARRPT